MGKEISHILCAEQTSQALEGSAGSAFLSLLRDNARAYHFGSIAADTFFYSVRIPFISKNIPCCGDMIHGAGGSDTIRPVHEMLKLLRDAPNDPLFGAKAAFAGGFLTHIALDSILHPYVYHVSGDYYADCPVERRQARIRHRLVEAWLDLHLLRQTSRDLAGCSWLRDIRRNSVVNGELLRFFFTASEKALDIEPTCLHDLERGYRVQMALNAAFGNAPVARLVRRADRLLAGRLGTFHALFYPWGRSEIPRDLIQFDSYLHPVTGEKREGGFQALWREALERSEIFLASLERFLFAGGDDDDLRSSVQGYNLCTGLVGVSMKGAVHYDCIPLERLLPR
jgi:hypothetical protein